MKLYRSFSVFFPIVCLVAQVPPPAPKPAPATQPTVTMSVENANTKAMPVVPPDRVVITVGDTTITSGQLDQIIDSLPEQYRATARGAGRRQFADNLVHILVLNQEGRRRKINETPSYKTQSAFQNANLLAGLTYTQITKDVPLDEAAVRKFYEEHKQEFEQVHAVHILVRMQGSGIPVKPGQKDLTEADALAKATELRKKLQEGADFAALATAESDDASSAVKGGDLGFVKHGQMVPSFDQAVFAMKPGELSEPVKSQFGYHIIRVDAAKSFEELRPDVERRMRPDAAQKALDDLQKKTNVVLDPEFFNISKQ